MLDAGAPGRATEMLAPAVDRLRSDYVPRAAASASMRPVGAPIRVAQCIATMRIGGSELNALRTIVRLDRTRFEPIVLTLDEHGPLIEHYREASVPVVAFGMPNLYGVQALREAMRLALFLRRARIDIVHAHDLYANLFVTLPSRIARVPSLLLSRRWETFSKTKHRIANRFAYKFAKQVLANSPSVARSLTSSDRVGAHRITVVPNFVDEVMFDAPVHQRAPLLDELGIPQDARVVGIIARLDPIKEHETLLHAASRLMIRWPTLHIVIVGDGERRKPLEQLCAALGLRDRVHFAGFRPNVPNLNHAFDVAVLCSRSEGFPNAIVEAMAAGRPVVASAIPGNADAVIHGETGLLAPAGDAAAFAKAIDTLLGDCSLAQRMGDAGRRRAHLQFNAQHAVSLVEELYESLIESHGRCSK